MEKELEYALKLMSFSQPNGSVPKGLFDFLGDWLERNGYKTERTKNALICFGNSNKAIFQGHIDTVPFDASGWKKSPTGEIGKGMLFGRGATDMKASVGALLAALEGCEKKPILVFTDDEEGGAFNGIRQAVSAIRKSGVRPECAVNMEPSDFRVVYARKGVLFAKVFTYGKAAHG